MENFLYNGVFTEKEVKNLNPLVLAFVGDAVYEVFIRSYLVSKNRDMPVHKLHVKAVQFVKAHSQSEIIKRLSSELSDEELYFFKRGRNTKSGTIPKNADVQEYKFATGFEALIGYLYLTKKIDRLKYLLDSIISLKI
ncbi:MAG: Mini-ribonuclease 3 [Clostridium sp.]|jgi:ribonuclease-3 family protein|uniref:Mini-ribonuclease 3 n=1 Tax=Clostridium sp. TaxID=1506 RepID=UPI0025B92332|nr:Mini-ribonuclease 3 [Clostridium sp.]MCH3965653.1 Mini-ribonuclease 3 [Clostridium sp.]MCI1717029.1 Mini-ribonuclease 3 [Clostridium sp.]MCI1801434.1 Mini-ribonuclease 3 [Clostridium sp.]MCI1815280.1 Mini-ribonuclease 3 [Clostridium sp.]MCI1872183.1 Mini-ribonuclease 3 [Clostridium sp.]